MQYWNEIATGLRDRGQLLRAFTLHADGAEHLRRIREDELEQAAAGWRQQRRQDYDQALQWLTQSTTVINTTALSAIEAAAEVTRRLNLPDD